MIMLPLHGQNTAASNTSNARGDVFGKQAGFVFAEFLLLLLIFPWCTPVLG